MKQVAGLALIGATMLAGCMDNSSGGTQAAPAVMTTRAEQEALWYNGEGTTGASPSTSDLGVVNFTGVIVDNAHVGTGDGVTGKVVAAIDFPNNLIDMTLSDFNSASSAIPGEVIISTVPNGSYVYSGSYNGTDVNNGALNPGIGVGNQTGNLVYFGGIQFNDGSLFSGEFVSFENVN